MSSLHVVLSSLHVVLSSLHVVLSSLHVALPSLHVAVASLHVVVASPHVVLAWPQGAECESANGRVVTLIVLVGFSVAQALTPWVGSRRFYQSPI